MELDLRCGHAMGLEVRWVQMSVWSFLVSIRILALSAGTISNNAWSDVESWWLVKIGHRFWGLILP